MNIQSLVLLMLVGLPMGIQAAENTADAPEQAELDTAMPPKAPLQEEQSSPSVQEDSKAQAAHSAPKEKEYAHIPAAHILYQKCLWRKVNLREKQNRPFFSHKREITRFILEGIRAGKLTPYDNDELSKTLTPQEVETRLLIPVAEKVADSNSLGVEEEQAWAKAQGGASTTAHTEQKAAAQATAYFMPNEVAQLEIKEKLIFDSHRSMLCFDIQTVKLIIPEDKFPDTGIRREVATLDFLELARYLDSCPEAQWLNVTNTAKNIRFSDAFGLRLFSSQLEKIENPKDLTIDAMYPNKSPQELARIAQEMEQELLADVETTFFEP